MVKEILGNKIELEFLPTQSSIHYEITPYCFKPKVAKKLVSSQFYDLGQGILECLSYLNNNSIDKTDEKSSETLIYS